MFCAASEEKVYLEYTSTVVMLAARRRKSTGFPKLKGITMDGIT